MLTCCKVTGKWEPKKKKSWIFFIIKDLSLICPIIIMNCNLVEHALFFFFFFRIDKLHRHPMSLQLMSDLTLQQIIMGEGDVSKL